MAKSAPRARSTQRLTCLIERDGDAYVSLCPEVDVASQGDSIEEARTSLIEAVESFLEAASPSEVRRRRMHATA